MWQDPSAFEAIDHDPGGRRKILLPAGVSGDAEFYGPMNCYRPRLRRWKGKGFPARFVLSIGMNPSNAAADVDDPTLTRDWYFAEREGFDGLVKCNTVDYRATFPADLRKPAVVAASERNLAVILEEAAKAELIILCHGRLDKVIAPYGRIVADHLRAAGHRLMCFGTNRDGSPRHSLYVPGETPLVEWRG